MGQNLCNCNFLDEEEKKEENISYIQNQHLSIISRKKMLKNYKNTFYVKNSRVDIYSNGELDSNPSVRLKQIYVMNRLKFLSKKIREFLLRKKINMTIGSVVTTNNDNNTVRLNTILSTKRKNYLETDTGEVAHKNLSLIKNKNYKSSYKKKLFNEVKSICQKLYDSDNEDNNTRMKIREDIINKVDNYIFSDLKNNILCPEVIDIKKKKTKYVTPKRYKNENKEKEKYNDINLITLEDIIKTYYEEPYLKSLNLNDLRMVTYGNYARNYTIFNHPQIYTLNSNYCSEKRLIQNKTPKKLKSLELTKLIPERKQDQTEINKQIYSVYKTLKIKKGIKFHI